MWPNPQFVADLVTFTEEIISGNLHIPVQCEMSLSDQFGVNPSMHQNDQRYSKNLAFSVIHIKVHGRVNTKLKLENLLLRSKFLTFSLKLC